MGTDQVKEYCIELRNQVHLQTDILLEQVHQFNEAVIAEIDEYEKKCVDSYQQKSVRYQTANKKFLTKLKKFYNENSKYLTEFKMDEQKIQDGLVQTVKYLVELKKRGS
jgi:transposase